jgi:hypothetical protein
MNNLIYLKEKNLFILYEYISDIFNGTLINNVFMHLLI